MYGVTSALPIRLRTIENRVKEIPGLFVNLNDINITGPGTNTHLKR